VQILTALTGATVIATDTQERAPWSVPAGGLADAVDLALAAGGHGVDAVRDFVGVDPTIALAMSVVALRGRVSVVGIGNGSYARNFYGVPYEVELTYWGTIEELHESSTSTGPAGSRRTSRSSRPTTHWRPTAVWNPAS
jgi:propanol-preferring alcohol dehydrogenase